MIVEHLIGPRVCRDVHLGAALGALPIGLAKPDPIVGILDRLRLRLERVILSPELWRVHEAGGDEDGDRSAEDGEQDVHPDLERRQVVGNDAVGARVVAVPARDWISWSDWVKFTVRHDRFAEVALVVLQRDVGQVVLVDALVDKVVLHVDDFLVLNFDDNVGVCDGKWNVGRCRLHAGVNEL